MGFPFPSSPGEKIGSSNLSKLFLRFSRRRQCGDPVTHFVGKVGTYPTGNFAMQLGTVLVLRPAGSGAFSPGSISFFAPNQLPFSKTRASRTPIFHFVFGQVPMGF